MYLNLAAFAVVVLVIAIWTTDHAVLIPAVIVSGIFIGVNNTVTTQAVMTVSPVERPVASAAYSFVRFIGGGLAPYAAGRLVMALNIHVPFYIGVRRDPAGHRHPVHGAPPARPGRAGAGRAGRRGDRPGRHGASLADAVLASRSGRGDHPGRRATPSGPGPARA